MAEPGMEHSAWAAPGSPNSREADEKLGCSYRLFEDLHPFVFRDVPCHREFPEGTELVACERDRSGQGSSLWSSRHEVWINSFLRSRFRKPRPEPELGVRTEDEINTRTVNLISPVLRSRLRTGPLRRYASTPAMSSRFRRSRW